MEFTPVVIGYIFTGLIGLIILLGFLWGIKRGLKKSLSRFIWLLVTLVLLVAFSGMISKALMHANVSFLNLSYEGIECSSLYQYFKTIIENNETIRQYIPNPATLSQFAETLPVVVGNLIVFVVLFWLAKILLWPFWAIMASKIAKKERRPSKKQIALARQENRTLPMPYPKRRMWGGLIGILSGVLVAVATLMPVVGLSNIFSTIDKEGVSAAESVQKQSLLKELFGEETAEYLLFYENSPGGKVFKYTGIDFVSNKLFDSVSTAKVNGKKIMLSNEIKTVTKVYSNFKRIEKMDFDNLTQEELTILLDASKDVVRSLFSSGIVASVFDEVVPDIIDSILHDENYEIKIPEIPEYPMVGEGIETILNSLNDITAAKVCDDAIKFIEILELFNDEGILYAAYKNDNDSLLSIMENLRADFADDVVDVIFNMYFIPAIAPVAVDVSVQVLCDILEVDYVANTTSNTMAALKSLSKTILNNSLEIFKAYDENNEMLLSTTAFGNVGIVLDALFDGNLMHEDTFAAIKAKAKMLAEEEIDKIEIEPEIKQSLKNAVTKIIQLTETENFSFEEEFEIFGSVTQKILDYQNAHPNLEIADYPLNVFGLWMDEITNSSLFNTAYDEFVDSAFETLVSKYAEGITAADLAFLKPSLKSITNSQTNNEWQTELSCLQDVYTKVKNLMNMSGELIDNIKAETSTGTVLSDIGRAIDVAIASNSRILTSSNLKQISKLFIDKVEIPAPFDTINIEDGGNTLTLVQKLQNNIDSVENYETEFAYLCRLLDIDMSGGSYALMGAALDDVKESLLLNGIIDPVLEHYINEYVEQVEDARLKTILTNVSANINNIQSYEAELSIVDQFDTIDFENVDINAVGSIFDNMKPTALFGPLLKDIVEYAVDKASEGLDAGALTIMVKVKSNIMNVINSTTTNFVTELAYIEPFISFDFDNSPLTEAGKTLDDASESVLLNDCIVDFVNYFIDKYVDGITDTTLKTIVTNIKNNIQYVTSYEAEFEIADQFKTIDFSDFSVIDYDAVGAMFDDMKTSQLFNNNSVLKDLISYAVDLSINNNFGTTPEDQDAALIFKNGIKSNINAVIASSVSFAAEFDYIFDFFEIMNTTPNEETIATIDSIGETSILLDGVLADFLEYSIDLNADNITETNIKTVWLSVKDETDNVTKFGQALNDLITLMGISFASDNLSTVGATFDSLKESELLGNKLNDFIGAIFDNISSEMDAKYSAQWITVKNNINQISSYEIELGYIDTLQNLSFNNYSALGATLDGLKASVLVSPVLNDFIKFYFEDEINANYSENAYNDVLVDIAGNFDNIPASSATYTDEFGYLQQAVNFVNLPSPTQQDFLDLYAQLTEGGQSKSILIDNDTLDLLAAHFNP